MVFFSTCFLCQRRSLVIRTASRATKNPIPRIQTIRAQDFHPSVGRGDIERESADCACEVCSTGSPARIEAVLEAGMEGDIWRASPVAGPRKSMPRRSSSPAWTIGRHLEIRLLGRVHVGGMMGLMGIRTQS